MMKIVPLLSFLLLLIIFAEHAKAKQDCKTDTGHSCKFPFTFQGVRYDACTTDHSKNCAPWCAVQVNNRGESVRNGVCAAICPGVVYGPVCGKDNRTYGNMCEAGEGNVNCPGECPCLLDVILDQLLDENSAFWNYFGRFWEGSCDSKDHCIDYVASCGDEGECRPSWWVWMILACIVLAVVVF